MRICLILLLCIFASVHEVYSQSCVVRTKDAGRMQLVSCLEPSTKKLCETTQKGIFREIQCVKNYYIGKCERNDDSTIHYNGSVESLEKQCWEDGGSWIDGPEEAILRGPMDEVQASLVSSKVCRVEMSDESIRFLPQIKISTGIIFHPGGFVDPRSYSPLARKLCDFGIRVEIMRYKTGIADNHIDQTKRVLSSNSGIDWYLMGHSQGGTSMGEIDLQNYSSVKGLVFLASYPRRSRDLSKTHVRVVSIYAEFDGLATPEKVLGASSRLPLATKYVEIEGGNHAQFGWYGEQVGDFEAQISREEQEQRVYYTIVKNMEH